MSPPPPPPPPPPMPNFDLKSQHKTPSDQPQNQRNWSQQVAPTESDLGGIDLVSPSGCLKPQMKMRTLNWRRIPKRRVLSQHILERERDAQCTQDDSLSQNLLEMRITSPIRGTNEDEFDGDNCDRTAGTDSKAASDSSDDEATNIWFKIAQSNNTIKRVERTQTPAGGARINTSGLQSDVSQDTITNSGDKSRSGGSQPITGTCGKSASRIRDMLEAVRRRMAAVAAASSPVSESENARTPTNGAAAGGATILQAYSLSSCKRPLAPSPSPAAHLLSPSRPRSVLDAMDFRDLESLFCLNNQPAPGALFDDDNNSLVGNFMRRSSCRSTATNSDSVISSSNSFDGNYADHDQQWSSGGGGGSGGYGDNLGDGSGGGGGGRGGNDDDNRDDSIDLLSENILDSKKSLNVNIFLKQLKNPDELIEQINAGNNKLIGEERLQSILRLLPEDGEQVQLMKFYARNKQHRLPVAERFLLKLLVRVPNLQLKVKFMLLKEKYYNDIDEQVPRELDKIDRAIRELRKSCKFREVLNLVLVTGNFLNSGGYAADAVGFSLDCLNRLNEVRSNREGVYLIHYIAEVAQKMQLVEFQRDELGQLESASRVCLESIKLDLVSMGERISELKCDIDTAGKAAHSAQGIGLRREATGGRDKGNDTSNQVHEGNDEQFLSNLLRTLEDIKCNVDSLKRRVSVDLEAKRKKLADYLCEDPATFSLHECFSCVQTFSRKLSAATEENERRVRLEMRKSSLKRSNTIHSRLPKQSLTSNSSNSNNSSARQQPLPSYVGGRKSLGAESAKKSMASALEPAYFDKSRASFGGYMSSERRQSFNSRQQASIARTPMAPSMDLVRTSSTCSSMVKSSLSSLSSNNTSSFGNSSDCDDLHDGLMRLLNDTTGRRSSGNHRRASGRVFGP